MSRHPDGERDHCLEIIGVEVRNGLIGHHSGLDCAYAAQVDEREAHARCEGCRQPVVLGKYRLTGFELGRKVDHDVLCPERRAALLGGAAG